MRAVFFSPHQLALAASSQILATLHPMMSLFYLPTAFGSLKEPEYGLTNFNPLPQRIFTEVSLILALVWAVCADGVVSDQFGFGGCGGLLRRSQRTGGGAERGGVTDGARPSAEHRMLGLLLGRTGLQTLQVSCRVMGAQRAG